MKLLKRILIALNVIAFLILVYVFSVAIIIPVNRAYLPLTKLEKPAEVTPKGKKNTKKSIKKTTKEVEQEPSSVEENISSTALQLRFDSLSLLRKQAAYLSARYDLSKQDSTYLVVDLIDSTASLEIKGISVHKARIKSIDKSNSLKLFHAKDFSLWLEYPFELKSAKATIAKIPMVIKNAPKDTIEAAKAEVIPTVPKREDVFITMNFTKNLRLVMSQAEELDSVGKIRIETLKHDKRKASFDKAIESLTSFQYDKIAPFINIKVSKEDATIIYRALPMKPQMVLRM